MLLPSVGGMNTSPVYHSASGTCMGERRRGRPLTARPQRDGGLRGLSSVRLQKGNVSITVPIYARDIPPGTVRGIIAQAGLTIEEFLEALDA